MTFAAAVKALRKLPTPFLAALLIGATFWVARCTAPGPAKPSRDSTALADYAKALADSAHASAKRDSSRNATVDSLTAGWARDRQTARIALQPRLRPIQPISPAPDSVRWLAGRVAALEAENDTLRTTLAETVAAADSTITGLRAAYADQQAETARLRVQLTQAGDSLAKAAVRIGKLERRDGCHRVLGVPLPELGAGYGIVASRTGGVHDGLTLALQWRLGCLTPASSR